MIFFTADTHFDHTNILRLCDRPFATVEEMNETLIANWNRKVHGNDTIYILGDMFFRTLDPEAILSRLKGKKHLILGNHDSQWVGKVDLTHWFESVGHFLEISDGQRGLTLCHFPLVTWSHQKRTYMIHGHIHGNTDMDYWPLLAARERVLNAGCDINNYEPVTFDELVANNAKFKNLHSQRTAYPLGTEEEG